VLLAARRPVPTPASPRTVLEVGPGPRFRTRPGTTENDHYGYNSHADGFVQDFNTWGSSRARAGGEMNIRAIRRTAAGLVLGLLPLLAVASCGEEPKKHFPGAFPGTHTDVSAPQAFGDFGIDVPASAKVVGYYAWSADDEYPMGAVLRMPCSALPGFVSGSGLRRASSQEMDIAGVQVFARDHGWTDDDKDERYLRNRDALAVVTHRTGTECKVYVHA
jgi:hypothetical protein